MILMRSEHSAEQLLRPKLLPLLTPLQCRKIVSLVKHLIEILSSDEVALDGRHSPAIYSRFLSTLLDKYYTTSLQNDIRSSDIYPQYRDNRELTPPHAFLWPDIPSVEGTPIPEAEQPAIHAMHVVREQAGEAEMDFSLSHFVQSTLPPTDPAPDESTHASVPPSLEGTYHGYTIDTIHQWQQPFNYAAMLDVAYVPYPFAGR